MNGLFCFYIHPPPLPSHSPPGNSSRLHIQHARTSPPCLLPPSSIPFDRSRTFNRPPQSVSYGQAISSSYHYCRHCPETPHRSNSSSRYARSKSKNKTKPITRTRTPRRRRRRLHVHAPPPLPHHHHPLPKRNLHPTPRAPSPRIPRLPTPLLRRPRRPRHCIPHRCPRYPFTGGLQGGADDGAAGV